MGKSITFSYTKQIFFLLSSSFFTFFRVLLCSSDCSETSKTLYNNHYRKKLFLFGKSLSDISIVFSSSFFMGNIFWRTFLFYFRIFLLFNLHFSNPKKKLFHQHFHVNNCFILFFSHLKLHFLKAFPFLFRLSSCCTQSLKAIKSSLVQLRFN
jgi:hypothetical protein